MTALGWILLLLGVCLLVVACWGVLRLPDALSRQHAATKAATLALGVMVVGVGLIHPHGAWWMRLVLLMAVLLLTLPLASHALARAAARLAGRQGQADDGA
ncbi:multisubunit sodium/proton antiporter MrpG subunit [Crenobacter luteus]|uniref:Cation:proton antiporter n=1 Tax=Crenobacter luteus TaxID=1452487 RepID=A0A165FK79_9NEIS|nr:monovalent cation/H(+) antiporter subunit G [Crenobacter luteus]KZE33534.1 hypothetical protein AVW16_08335 [Crenobacter luteus]TCP13030.1 multisubunit sodium/proton antiporter MrpG subunit [Crenobacter luteus]